MNSYLFLGGPIDGEHYEADPTHDVWRVIGPLGDAEFYARIDEPITPWTTDFPVHLYYRVRIRTQQGSMDSIVWTYEKKWHPWAVFNYLLERYSSGL